MTGLPISSNWKRDRYNFILIMIALLINMIYSKSVKITINAPRLAKVIIEVVIQHHGLPNLIVDNRGFLFTLKFWSLFCYFLGIKSSLSIAFHPQTDGQTKWQKSIIEGYLQAFINFEQKKWAKFLLMTEFAYNNAENASTGQTLFEFTCGYHYCVFFEEDTNLCS